MLRKNSDDSSNNNNICARDNRRTTEPHKATRQIDHPELSRAGLGAGLFNALFFGGMGRVSLKCHTPTQTAR